MRTLRLFAFDFDGTLVDTKRDIADSVNLTLEELNVRTLPRETIYECIGSGVGPLLKRSLNGTGFEDLTRAVEVFIHHYEEHLMDHTRFYPNCRETLEFFSNKTIAICSNKPARFIRKILEELGCLDQFSTIVGGDDAERKKPDPGGLLNILSIHGVSPDEAVMVGDSPIDIETGRGAKVRTCAVSYGLSNKEELEKAQPDWLIDDIRDLRNLFS